MEGMPTGRADSKSLLPSAGQSHLRAAQNGPGNDSSASQISNISAGKPSWYYCSEMFISQQFPGSPAYPAAEQRRDLLLIAFVDSNGWVEEKNSAWTRVSLYPRGVAAVCVYF